MFRASSPNKEELAKIVIVLREYKMALSRLSVTALDNNKNNREYSVTFLFYFVFNCLTLISLYLSYIKRSEKKFALCNTDRFYVPSPLCLSK